MTARDLVLVGSYDYRLIAVSIVIAITASYTALDLAGRVTSARARGRLVWLICGTTVMGIGIWSMHNTAMAAATFTRSAAAPDLSLAVSISFLGTVGIGIVTLMVLGITMLTCLVDRLQEQRALLDELFEQSPQAVALLNADNRVVRV